MKLQHRWTKTCVTMTAAQIAPRQSVLSGTRSEAMELGANFQILALPFPLLSTCCREALAILWRKWLSTSTHERSEGQLYVVWEATSPARMRVSSWTTSSIFGRFSGSWAQHLSMRVQTPSVRPRASSRFGLSPRLTLIAIEAIFTSHHGGFCVQT